MGEDQETPVSTDDPRPPARSPLRRLYHTWLLILARCEHPWNPDYRRYGGRGVTVCPEWHRYDTFEAWALSAGYEAPLTIHRIDNDGPYAPHNCRWVPMEENRDERWRRAGPKTWRAAFERLKCPVPKMSLADCGRLGGKARRDALVPEERAALARQAAEARWKRTTKRERSEAMRKAVLARWARAKRGRRSS